MSRPLNSSWNPCQAEHRRSLARVITLSTYHDIMGLDCEDSRPIISHTLEGLREKRLFDRIRSESIRSSREIQLGIGATPSIGGFSLFLWASGRPDIPTEDFFMLTEDLPEIRGIEVLNDLKVGHWC